MKHCWIGVMLLLGGCAATGDWTKTGADPAATARDYEDCRDLAAAAVRTDANIDQDILAARSGDVQRTSIARVGTRAMQEHTGDRAGAIVASCMQAKGYAKPG
jgi:hypothetical protein